MRENNDTRQSILFLEAAIKALYAVFEMAGAKPPVQNSAEGSLEEKRLKMIALMRNRCPNKVPENIDGLDFKEVLDLYRQNFTGGEPKSECSSKEQPNPQTSTVPATQGKTQGGRAVYALGTMGNGISISNKQVMDALAKRYVGDPEWNTPDKWEKFTDKQLIVHYNAHASNGNPIKTDANGKPVGTSSGSGGSSSGTQRRSSSGQGQGNSASSSNAKGSSSSIRQGQSSASKGHSSSSAAASSSSVQNVSKPKNNTSFWDAWKKENAEKKKIREQMQGTSNKK
jgi:hypothetical protein